MNGAGADGTEPLTVVRRIAAPPEVVFSYLTDPARFVRWMGVGAELDPRPGGAYRIEIGPSSVARGEYRVVDPPRRLVFSWGWEGDAEVGPGTTTVEVLLRDEGGDTVLELRHSGLPTPAARRLHSDGWDQYLRQLMGAAVAGEGLAFRG